MKTTAIILVILGGFITLLNLSIPVRFYLLRKKGRSYSCIPVLGGVMLFVGMLLWDNPLLRNFSFLALFVDIGCVPMVAFALYKLVANRKQ